MLTALSTKTNREEPNALYGPLKLLFFRAHLNRNRPRVRQEAQSKF